MGQGGGEGVLLMARVSFQVCGKSFNRMYNLLGHMHLHAGSKPFKCPYCSSKFNLKGNLSRHMKVKHGVMDISLDSQGRNRLGSGPWPGAPAGSRASVGMTPSYARVPGSVLLAGPEAAPAELCRGLHASGPWGLCCDPVHPGLCSRATCLCQHAKGLCMILPHLGPAPSHIMPGSWQLLSLHPLLQGTLPCRAVAWLDRSAEETSRES